MPNVLVRDAARRKQNTRKGLSGPKRDISWRLFTSSGMKDGRLNDHTNRQAHEQQANHLSYRLRVWK
jgi:hypothetical protein